MMTTTWRRIGVYLAALPLFVPIAITAGGQPARASGNCDAGAVCLYSLDLYGGTRTQRYAPGCHSLENSVLQNTAESLINHAGVEIALFDWNSCFQDGWRYYVDAGAHRYALPTWVRNDISSIYITRR